MKLCLEATQAGIDEPEPEVPCTILPTNTEGTCVHEKCRIASIPDERIRRRLTLNNEIRWHLLENWARFERAEARGSKSRNRVAKMIREIRKRGELSLAVVIPALLWGAATERSQ